MKKAVFALLVIYLILYGCVPPSIQQDSSVKPSIGVPIPPNIQRIAVTEFIDGRADTSSYPNPAPEVQEKIINGLVMKNMLSNGTT